MLNLSTNPNFALLAALSHRMVPTILVASKCDTSAKWSVTAKKIDGICKDHRNVELFQIFWSTLETQKRCLSIILRNIMLEIYGKGNRTSYANVSNLSARSRSICLGLRNSS